MPQEARGHPYTFLVKDPAGLCISAFSIHPDCHFLPITNVGISILILCGVLWAFRVTQHSTKLFMLSGLGFILLHFHLWWKEKL